MKERGQMGLDQLIPWLLGLAALAVVVILYIASSDKGNSIIDSLKNMWRFGS